MNLYHQAPYSAQEHSPTRAVSTLSKCLFPTLSDTYFIGFRTTHCVSILSHLETQGVYGSPSPYTPTPTHYVTKPMLCHLDRLYKK